LAVVAPEARACILAQQQEVDQLRSQLSALAIELARLREQIGHSRATSPSRQVAKQKPTPATGVALGHQHGARTMPRGWGYYIRKPLAWQNARAPWGCGSR